MRVALTFDTEHPGRPTRVGTEHELLDALAAADVRATFFLQGRWTRAFPEVARRIEADGHLIGNHSNYHAPMDTLSEEGLRRDIARAVFDAARAGDEGAQFVVDEVARRIALHLAPVAAVADVELVVLGGGIGSNGDLLLEPVRSRLAEWLPFPPRVEVSTVGEAAVLTGALAVGVRAALDNVVAAPA